MQLFPDCIGSLGSIISYLCCRRISLGVQLKETAEKEVQDTSCRWCGGVPQLKKVPQDWGIRGLIETIATVSITVEYPLFSFLWRYYIAFLPPVSCF